MKFQARLRDRLADVYLALATDDGRQAEILRVHGVGHRRIHTRWEDLQDVPVDRQWLDCSTG
jgi:hypothetical protein